MSNLTKQAIYINLEYIQQKTKALLNEINDLMTILEDDIVMNAENDYWERQWNKIPIEIIDLTVSDVDMPDIKQVTN